eukprot:COSAG02_NODE_3464_length_6695_cov_12.759854_7_plen_94_part_00
MRAVNCERAAGVAASARRKHSCTKRYSLSVLQSGWEVVRAMYVVTLLSIRPKALASVPRLQLSYRAVVNTKVLRFSLVIGTIPISMAPSLSQY